MLKKSYNSEAEIPESQRAFYTEKDGRWVLQVEGMVDADRLKEFRDQNVALQKENGELKAAYKDIPADKAGEFVQAHKDSVDGKLVKKEGLDAAVAQRVAEAKAAADAAIAEAKAKQEAAEKALERQQLSIALRDAGAKFGLRPEAAADLEARGLTVLKPVDGKLVAHDATSGTPLYNPSDATPMGVDQWVEKLTKDAPHLFAESKGAGAPGSSNTPGHAGPNPWSDKTLNLTQQAAIMKTNPALAARLKAAANS